MRKYLTVLFILIPFWVFSQEGIRYSVTAVEFTKSIDSTVCNSYTQVSIDWDKGYGDKWFTGGEYSLYLYADSTKNSSTGVWVDTVLVGDTDSLFVYIKERVPSSTSTGYTTFDSYEVSNDSTFLTSGSSGAGFDFDLDKWYRYDFSLSPAKGVDIFLKRQSQNGGLTYRFILTK